MQQYRPVGGLDAVVATRRPAGHILSALYHKLYRTV
jgi:hypothetical protein